MFEPEDIFSPGRFHCPGCHATLKTAPRKCPHCEFTAESCLARFPFEPPPLKRLMDPDQSLKAYQKKRLSSSIERLEKAFPQITVSFCSLYLPDGVDGRQFGYWMLNRCKPASGLDARSRLHHLLILVDRNHKTASATVGYGLDCFLDDMTLYQTLQQSREHFLNKGFVEGSINWINRIRKKLPSIHEKAQIDWKRRFKKRHRYTAGRDLAEQGKTRLNDEIAASRPHSPGPRPTRSGDKPQLDVKIHA